jgi:hypothetical protein
MNYNILTIKDQFLGDFLTKLKKTLPNLSICDPDYFLPTSSVYNTHYGNSNYIFKVKNNSNLNYVIFEVSTKDQITLTTIANSNNAYIENIFESDLDKETNHDRVKLCGLLILMFLDLGLAMVSYIINFRNFEYYKKTTTLNICTIVSGLYSLVSMSVLTFDISTLLNLKPIFRIPFYNTNLYFMFGLLVLYTIIVKIFIPIQNTKITFSKPIQVISELKID